MSKKQDEDCEWCEKEEKLLIRWAEKAAGYRWLHNHARLFYTNRNDWLAYPSIIIASMTGVGGFAVLNPSGSESVSTSAKNNIIYVQYFFAFLNVMGGILTSISKFSQSLSLSEAHSVHCVQWSKLYRSIDMELSLDAKHRSNIVQFREKLREDYDKLLESAPNIPAITIKAYLIQFPDKENKPDVCNGLSMIVNDDAASLTSSRVAVTRWLGAFNNISIMASKRRRSSDLERDGLHRVESV
tara:strand:+ start:1659 stop:2384 length:726 start_codon:yes stop_codon:yes gene_type:complete